MVRKKKNPLTVLVVGASGNGYGAAIANTLESEGHTVFSMQRRPRFRPHLEAEFDAEFWCDSDLEEPAQTIMAVRQIYSHDIKLDGVVHAALYSEETELEMLTSFELQKAFQINVIEPLMLMRTLLDFGVLRWDGLSVFFTDPRKFGTSQKASAVSKACVQSAVSSFAFDWPVTFKYLFLEPPESGKMGAGDAVSDTVLRLFEGRKGFKNKELMQL